MIASPDVVLARVRAAPLWLHAAIVFTALRFVSWLLLEQAALQQEWTPGVTGPREGEIDLALNWDAVWYQRIVNGGYPDELPVGEDGRVQQNPWAFYPVFPYLVRLVMALTGGDFAAVAPKVALLAGLGAAVVMAYLFRDTLAGRAACYQPLEVLPSPQEGRLVLLTAGNKADAGATRLALAGVAVWGAWPVSPVLQMAYTESLSMLLLVSTLYLLVKQQWWWAAAGAVALGLTRPIALPLLVVVIVCLVLRWRERRSRPIDSWESAGLAGLLTATGLSGVLWLSIAWAGTGRRDAYPSTMEAWRGEAAINPIEPWKRTVEWAWTTHEQMWVLTALGMLVPLALSLILLIPGVAPGVDVRLRVWCAAYATYLLAVVDGHTSIFRYLVPLFPLALVLVGAHRGWRSPFSRWWGLRTTFWVAVGVCGQVWWIWWLVLYNPPAGQYGDWPP